MKIDKTDYKILYELDIDARQSYSKLAKKVRLSQESVRYRVNRLVQNGVIHKFFTVIDGSKLGYAMYKILLKLQNINEAKLQEIINYFIDHPQVVWVATLDGSYDLGMTILGEHILKLNKFIEELNQNFSFHINRRFFSVNVLGEFLPRNYFVHKKRALNHTTSYSIELPRAEVDEVDLQIIRELTDDGRRSAVEIARKVGVSPDTILQRKKRLETEKIVTKYNILTNPDALNMIRYKVLIHLNIFSPERVFKFLDFCRTENSIVYIIKALGQWNYELDMEVHSIDEHRRIMMQIMNDYSDIIRDYDTLIIRKVYKYNFFPKG
ncbi:MAG: Lrp/AsnC family transcriptional regulator [bacterium]|jgi:Lrp/AsnC family leucine-responsive transcriptional regulator|nr:Lrp/AsnC family transcriptional regulator [bacterium]